MEDGCVGGFVQRGIVGAPNEQAVLEMGGVTAESSESRTTEASVRGFWKASPRGDGAVMANSCCARCDHPGAGRLCALH